MKTSKSPEGTEVTPSKKKLKQARLPFKIISEVSPKSVTPICRKRKLSTPDVESVTKLGKISKENDIVEDAVIIIDEDSKDGKEAEITEKLPNPYVKLVDAARKKKLRKSKSSKNKKEKDIAKDHVEDGSANINGDVGDGKTEDDCEMMEVDAELKNEETISAKSVSDKDTVQNDTETIVTKSGNVVDNIVFVEDSNTSTDATQTVAENGESSEKSEENRTISNGENLDSELVDVTGTDLKEPHETNKTESKEENDKLCTVSSDTENDKKNLETDKPKAPITPKRSARNKANHEKNNNTKGSPSTSKLNESISSNLSTPKQSRSSSITKLDESVNESTPSINLTPKQLQKKLESAKKREEREKEKQDRDKKKQQEKEDRAKQRQEKEDQRKREREEKEDAKRKEKEEKEEQRKKEREEKEKIKELEKKQREEKEEQKRKEKEEKEEQRRKEREAREEEKRKKQEALELEKQEQELKKKKTAEAFVSFFVPKQKAEKDQPTVGLVSNNMLSSFTLKSDMRLAPTTRTCLSEEKAEELVRLIKEQGVKEENLYLRRLKNGVKPLSSGKTWPQNDRDDDVILVEDELPPIDGAGEIITCEPTDREKLRPKLLSFHDNRRPPYWGTWRKQSKFVKPRRPFGQDEKQLDYEADSDEEWEEEQEGESIDGSAAGSDDEQGPDEYEVDNEVFVPHGYLSDEEATMDDDDVLSLSPETQKAKLKHLEDEFESEMKKPTEKLKPRLYSLLWENSEGGKPDKCVDAMWNYFNKLSMIMNDPAPLLQPSQEPEETEKKKVKKKKTSTVTDGEQSSPKVEKKKKVKLQEKEGKPSNQENKNKAQDVKKNQPGINVFLTKLKST